MEIFFYEKPGCVNNTRQKAVLRELGHVVVARDLLREAWTVERLAGFFHGRSVTECFNPTAPRIKSGEVRPESLSWPEALRAMLADPLLIRRPLIETEEGRTCGFDEDDALLRGLGIGQAVSGADLQTCTRTVQPRGTSEQAP